SRPVHHVAAEHGLLGNRRRKPVLGDGIEDVPAPVDQNAVVVLGDPTGQILPLPFGTDRGRIVDDVAKSESRPTAPPPSHLEGREELVADSEGMLVREENVRAKRLDRRPEDRRPNGYVVGERDREPSPDIEVVVDLSDPGKLQDSDVLRDAEKADRL